MGIIVAIGGGEIKDLETLEIDRVIVGLSGKNNPQALFIPTASGDAENYYDVFRRVYAGELGCSTDVLYLIREKPDEQEIRDKILGADIIYVGGGNTLKMMEIWRENKLDIYLKKAWEKNIILAGLSAGSICWFKYGHSDSEYFAGKENWSYIKVDGLGFIDAFHCPHFNEDTREEDFMKMLKEYDEINGIALDNNSALIVVDDKYRVITASEGANAYKIYSRNGEIVKEVIKEEVSFNDLKKLIK